MAEKYTAEEMIAAARASGGVIAAAARMLGCSRNTVRRYIRTYVTVKEAFDEQNEVSLDVSEGYLMQFCRGTITVDGEKERVSHREQLDAIKYHLSTKGKARGYTKKHEREHSGRLRHVSEIDWESLTDEQVEALAAGAAPADVFDL